MINTLLLNINAIVCFLTALRMMTFQRKDSDHNWVGSVFAYVLIVACAAVTIRIITGDIIKINPAETLINITLCVSLFLSRGNVMHFFKRRGNRANQ
ncbi:phage holin family protein [Hafnia alvei]|nr:phage holin family protein [Hafnia alvei]